MILKRRIHKTTEIIQTTTPVILNRRKKQEEISLDKWENIISSSENCFVCGKPLVTVKKKKALKKEKRDYIYIGKHQDGGSLFRHFECCAGSVKWEKKFGTKYTIIKENAHE